MMKGVSYFIFGMRFLILTRLLGKKIPFNGAIIVNELCNLACKHCSVSNSTGTNVEYDQVARDLNTLYSRGIRFLEISGGEPSMYESQRKKLEDIIGLAREIGFYEILLCTNGTFPINTSADYVWVSIDGDKTTHDRIRGKTYERIMGNITNSKHNKIFVNFTISQMNHMNLDVSVKEILSNQNIRGILFHFFIPYKGSKDIGINGLENKVIEDILMLKRRYGKKICNTTKALGYLKERNWKKPVWGSCIIYKGKISPCCCRSEIVEEDICNSCLSTPGVETYNVQNITMMGSLEIMRNFLGCKGLLSRVKTRPRRGNASKSDYPGSD